MLKVKVNKLQIILYNFKSKQTLVIYLGPRPSIRNISNMKSTARTRTYLRSPNRRRRKVILSARLTFAKSNTEQQAGVLVQLKRIRKGHIVQDDPSGSSKPPVDFKARPGQARPKWVGGGLGCVTWDFLINLMSLIQLLVAASLHDQDLWVRNLVNPASSHPLAAGTFSRNSDNFTHLST